MDEHKNFSTFRVVTPPSPAASGTEIVVSPIGGAVLPAPPFNMTVGPVAAEPTTNNAEIVRVIAAVGYALTIERAQEGTSARAILAGDRIDNTITVKVVTDIEDTIAALLSSVASLTAELATRPRLVAVPGAMNTPATHPSFAVDAFYRYETIADDTWKQIPHADF